MTPNELPDYAGGEELSETLWPTSIQDIIDYDNDEVTDGYVHWSADDAVPGPNHSAAYRWGWSNARYDRTKEDDGFVSLRLAAARWMRESGYLKRLGATLREPTP